MEQEDRVNKKQWHDLWLKERDEVIRALDVEKFKEFYVKWQARGLYKMPLPSDEVIELSLRKMLHHLGNATEEEKTYAENWLHDHGSSTML